MEKKKKEKPECKIYLPSSSPKSKHLHLNQGKWQAGECAAPSGIRHLVQPTAVEGNTDKLS